MDLFINKIINNKYKIIEKIGEGGMSFIYLAEDINNENKKVSIKFIKNEKISNRLENIIHFRNESNIISRLNHPNIIKVYEIGEILNHHYIIMEYINGKSLYNIIKDKEKFNLEKSIDIIIQIIETLIYIHNSNIIHRDLKPGNIMIKKNNKQLEVKLIDFGLAHLIEFSEFKDKEEIIGTFSYMSPEQCGVIKRTVDQRSDLYSLGIIFYQLLTGELPFKGDKISIIIHQHIAKIPENPIKIKKKIPLIIEKIVLKLIEKEPEKRYQSAEGILNDLKKYKRGENDFTPGLDDKSINLIYKTSLIGREEELKKLKNLFEDLLKGKGNLCLISGEAGRGKTRLVEELENHVYFKDTTFICGKCFSGENKIPYLLFKDALNMYLKIFYRYSQEKKKEIKIKIKETIGDLGEIILKINPLVKEIIGECLPLVSLEPEKENQRFLMTASKFFQGLTKIEGRLIIILDDLQWIEEGSLSILKEIIKDKYNIPLLIIGTYRDNEVTEEHKLQHFINDIKNKNLPLKEIKLSNFDDTKTNKFIASLLFDKEENVKEISNIILNKSKGNPLFTIEITRLLVDNKAIEREEGRWKINNELLNTIEFSSTIIEALLKRISLLSQNEKELLSYAALIGRKFDIDLLFNILENFEKEEVVRIIDKGIELQLIELDSNEKGKILFVHDRIKEAFEKIIDETNKKYIHLKIARNMEEKNREEIIKNINECTVLFDLINHYLEANDKEKILEYAYPSGIKAQKSYANEEAVRYFSIIVNLLKDTKNQLVINSKKNIAEIYLVIGRFDEAIVLSKEILKYEKSKIEKAKIYKNISQAYFKKGNWNENENYAKIGLKILGEKLPIKKFEVNFSILKEFIIFLIHSIFPIIYINKKPDSKNEKYKLIIWYYYSINWVYALSNTLKMVRSILRMKNIADNKIGISEEMALSYAAFGNMAMIIGFFKKAEFYHKKSIKICEYLNYQWTLAESYLFLTANYTWQGKYENGIEYSLKSIDIFNKIGDSRELGVSIHQLVQLYFYMSNYNKSLTQNLIFLDQSIKSNNNDGIINSYLNLFVTYGEMGDLKKAEEYGLKGYKLSYKSNNKFSNCCISICLGLFYYETALYDDSLKYLNNARTLDEENNFMKHYTVLCYPILCDLYIEMYKNNHIKKVSIKEIKKLCKYSLKVTKKWITNYGYALRVNAKYYVLIGKDKEARKYFNKSIKQCAEIGRKYEEAKGYYEYGVFLNKINNKEKAKSQWENSYKIFKEIGSEYYLKKIAGLLEIKKVEETNTERLIETQRYSSIIKLSQDISSILNISELLESIMAKAIEVTGAQRGYLFIFNEGTQELELKVRKNIDLEDENKYSKNIVEKVFKECKPIITSNADLEKEYKDYPSVLDYGLKSIIAVPIMHGEKAIGVCYLDNPLSRGVFTKEDLELLGIFVSQATITIENANLYQNLEKKVKERTIELEEANKKLKELDILKTNSFANISHELRTPLTLILGPLESIISGRYGNKINCDDEKLKMMLYNSTKLLKLINNLLDFTKIEAGKINVKKSRVDISQLLRFIISNLQVNAKNMGLNIAYNNNTDSHRIMAYIDRDLLEKAIFNLISNSLKFTSSGGQIIIQLDANDNNFMISVKDDGIGIPEDKLETIFERFHQIDSSASRKYEGTGIGLALTKEIVGILGGKISVKSKINEGSTFIITLPYERINEINLKDEENEPNETKPFMLLNAPNEPDNMDDNKEKTNSKKIIIIEDNPDMQKYLKSILGTQYIIMQAKNGKEGLEKVIKEKPDLILADVMMPEMDGYQMTEIIKSKDELKGIPVILLTAKADIFMKIEGFEKGADDYIVKPFDSKELSARIKAHLEIKRLRDEVIKQKDEIELIFKENITAHKNLEKSEKRFREMAENLPAAIIEINLKNKITYFNHYAKQLFNISLEYDFLDLIDLSEKDKVIKYFEELYKKENSELREYKFLSKNGSKITGLIKSILLYEQNKAAGIRLTILEIEPNFNIILLPDKEFNTKHDLSERETEVIVLLIKGLSYNQIGEKLFISYKTVEKHISNIYKKTKVTSRYQLIELIQEKK